jgi:hypothetical protein
MKVGLTLTTHRSKKLRPNGAFLLDQFFQSFRDSNFKYDYCFFISDNASEIAYEYPTDINYKLILIKNQSINGLTGAWNLGIDAAYKDGCDIIWNFNDDLELNSSINVFIEHIQTTPGYPLGIYGPLSNEGGHEAPNNSTGPKNGVTQLEVVPGSMRNVLNGFSFAITKEVYERYSYKENEFFPLSHPMDGGDGKWGGQEGYFSLIADGAIKFYLINECWIKHHKYKAWEKTRDLYR